MEKISIYSPLPILSHISCFKCAPNGPSKQTYTSHLASSAILTMSALLEVACSPPFFHSCAAPRDHHRSRSEGGDYHLRGSNRIPLFPPMEPPEVEPIHR